MKLLAAAMALILSVAFIGPAQSAELVMFEEAGCVWCERWNDEIGSAYANTDEGRLAPLRRVDLDAPRPTDLVDVSSVAFTPTFVVMDGGKEYGRIVGYPGQDFFWPTLQNILSSLPGAGGTDAVKPEEQLNDAAFRF